LSVFANSTALRGDAGTYATSGNSATAKSVRILVAYYSRTGNTEQMARGVAEGARRVGTTATQVKKVGEVSKEDLVAADGIILGCPTYFANIAGEMKTIIDDWNWKLKVNFTDKVGGAFATAGGQVGGQGHVVTSLLLFMLNNRMVVAGPIETKKPEASGESRGPRLLPGRLIPALAKRSLKAPAASASASPA